MIYGKSQIFGTAQHEYALKLIKDKYLPLGYDSKNIDYTYNGNFYVN